MKYSSCNKIESDRNQLINVMLLFVRAAVLGKDSVIPQEIEIDWDNLMDLASQHGVLAWVWDGICKLPSEQQPPRQQRISWGLSVQEVHDNYYLHKNKLLQMIEICDANGMKLLLLKGIGLSEYYPKPCSRQSRDIDIYLFDDCEKGNELLLGGEVELHGKHYVYTRDGVQIENHIQMFSDVSPLHKKIEDYIEASIGDSYKTEDGYYMMPQECLVIYLLMHSLIHLCHPVDPIRIQNIVDFGMVLKRSDGDLPSRLHNLVVSLNIEKAFILFVFLSEWVLDIDLSRFVPRGQAKPDDFDSAVRFIIDEDLRCPSFSNLPKYRKLSQRWSYYKQVRWRYKYIPSFNSRRIRVYMRDLCRDTINMFFEKRSLM